MKKKLLILSLALGLVLATCQVAFATGTGSNCTAPGVLSQNSNWVPLADKLNLNDQQIQQLKEINLSTYQSTKDLKVKLLDAKFQLRQLGIESTDKTAINAKIKEINDLKAQIRKIYQQQGQKIKSVLTPEQQSKLKDMKGFGHLGGQHMKVYQ